MSSNTNKLVSTLSAINPDSLPSFSSNSGSNSGAYVSNPSSNSSFMDFFSNLTWQTWLIFILILAFLGINIFSYLEMGTEKTKDIFAPVLKLFGYETLETTRQTVETSATGTKAGVDIVSDTTTGAIDIIEEQTQGRTSSNKNNNSNNNNNKNNNSTNNQVTGKQTNNVSKNAQSIQDQQKIENQINELENMQQQNLQKALDDSKNQNSEPRPDDSLSRIQASGSGKGGWCFIGEDRGIRSCSQIGQNDQCMSGDIFPSQEICMNPNLRP
jgi:hypothetical protein